MIILLVFEREFWFLLIFVREFKENCDVDYMMIFIIVIIVEVINVSCYMLYRGEIYDEFCYKSFFVMVEVILIEI